MPSSLESMVVCESYFFGLIYICTVQLSQLDKDGSSDRRKGGNAAVVGIWMIYIYIYILTIYSKTPQSSQTHLAFLKNLKYHLILPAFSILSRDLYFYISEF